MVIKVDHCAVAHIWYDHYQRDFHFYFFRLLYSTLIHLPPLRFLYAGIEPTITTLALAVRRSNHSARSHPRSLNKVNSFRAARNSTKYNVTFLFDQTDFRTVWGEGYLTIHTRGIEQSHREEENVQDFIIIRSSLLHLQHHQHPEYIHNTSVSQIDNNKNDKNVANPYTG